MRRALVLAYLAAASATGATAFAQSSKPPVPAGRDPGGVAIALLTTGVDYTLPEVARRLARDGEGELIGWDLGDKDRAPFDTSRGDTGPQWGGDGTALASFLLQAGNVRLVPVRVDPTDPASLARAIAFVAQTPARIAVLPMWSTSRPGWEPFRQAANHFNDILIIVPAGEGESPVYPAALRLDSVMVVAHATADAEVAGFGGRTRRLSGPGLAVATTGRSAAALLAREPRLGAGSLKGKLTEAVK